MKLSDKGTQTNSKRLDFAFNLLNKKIFCILRQKTKGGDDDEGSGGRGAEGGGEEEMMMIYIL